ncbi:MAG: hypothetical protein IID18_01850 [Nitrospinae bacterium]|nr:hypothetical protein [Nitrospinota bacterium]
MGYLRDNVRGREVEYYDFLDRVEVETEDPDWHIANHPFQKYLDRYSPQFRQWVGFMEKLLFMKQSGFPLEKNDLSFFEWECLAVIDHYYQTGFMRKGSE